MIRRPIRRPQNRPKAIADSHPAPVGGWNARDSLAEMDVKDAVTMDNWWPNPSDVMARFGYTQFCVGLPSYVESLMNYSGPTAEQLIAASGTAFYNITSGGAAANYLSLNGASGDYASTPDSAALDIVGDIDLMCYVALDDWTPGGGFAGGASLISKWVVAGNQASYQLWISLGGTISISWSVTGAGTLGNFRTAVSDSAVPILNGQSIWVRAVLDVDNGLGGYTATFYTSTSAYNTVPASIVWTQLGAPVVTTAGITSIFSSTSPLEIGANNGGTARRVDGKIFRGLVYGAAVLKASFNASDAAVGATSIISSATGETYTAFGTAVIAGQLTLSGLSNARWQYQNISTAGGSFMLCVNGVDKLRGYNGTTWWTDGDGAHDITGVDTATCNNINLFQHRIWLIQENSLKAWYLPTDSIAGAAAALDFSSIARYGGSLVAMGTWTIDAGYGMDDLAAFVTNQGEVIVYKGTDPTSSTTWALVGVFEVGAAFSPRCLLKFGGDMLFLTYDGLYPLSTYLQSSRTDPKKSLSDKIYQALGEATTLYGSNFGWDIEYYAKANMVLVNIPVNDAGGQVQFAMNAITKAWCSFSGMGASCWVIHNDDLYFGGNTYVAQAWNGLTDYPNGVMTNIATNCLTAFSDFGNPGTTKRWAMIRPIFLTNGSPSTLGGMNIDFDLSDNTGSLSFSPSNSSVWDMGLWDLATWSGGLAVSKNWQSVNGLGTWAAMRIKTATNGIETHWVSTTYTHEQGGII